MFPSKSATQIAKQEYYAVTPVRCYGRVAGIATLLPET